MVVIVLLVAVNVRGLGESAKLNVGLAVADLVTQVLLVAIGAVLALNPKLLVQQVHLGVAPTASQLLFAVSISMLAYTGIETVSNMAEEARDPGRDVPRTVNLLLIAVLGIYAGMTTIGISALPVVQHGQHVLDAARHDLPERSGAGDHRRVPPVGGRHEGRSPTTSRSSRRRS